MRPPQSARSRGRGVRRATATAGRCRPTTSPPAALDLADGRERWRRSLGTAVYGSSAGRRELGFFAGVALAGRRMLVASDRVHCLDASDGATLWESRPAPALGGGRLVVGTGAQPYVPGSSLVCVG
ncbi:PQQ-binding-like beta-propeller repeat protein [Conexibacter sp. JD483]|uniref:outer membrane protein assembly factor BamB family protein n=1 Tax=unclassified Conexibacter TaxID=2627773 RepID=UPI0027200099|nr:MULTISPECIES: PQQ-binding-like beta-propeller repeat protein [unclassified Conexibacter]MDO8186301.1 PQQ-binding-like beta-propeller repeat protein [Conexibacter sp. CPCC 205706]MDO8197506.1 PQQ-binding-like beta-propeller repeat protein [Conexibacter sp. CPCC 205762]MDR9370289.1 PQQ-binding-like beta-propeller repeat protein [Conexibacter sp. JD483]